MTSEMVITAKGELSRCRLAAGERITRTGDFLDLMGSCRSETIVLAREDLDEAFFDLKTGLAGEILQKVSNYRKRLVILGDFRKVASRSLRDFIYESNGTGQVVFAPDLESAVALLK